MNEGLIPCCMAQCGDCVWIGGAAGKIAVYDIVTTLPAATPTPPPPPKAEPPLPEETIMSIAPLFVLQASETESRYIQSIVYHAGYACCLLSRSVELQLWHVATRHLARCVTLGGDSVQMTCLCVGGGIVWTGDKQGRVNGWDLRHILAEQPLRGSALEELPDAPTTSPATATTTPPATPTTTSPTTTVAMASLAESGAGCCPPVQQPPSSVNTPVAASVPVKVSFSVFPAMSGSFATPSTPVTTASSSGCTPIIGSIAYSQVWQSGRTGGGGGGSGGGDTRQVTGLLWCTTAGTPFMMCCFEVSRFFLQTHQKTPPPVMLSFPAPKCPQESFTGNLIPRRPIGQVKVACTLSRNCNFSFATKKRVIQSVKEFKDSTGTGFILHFKGQIPRPFFSDAEEHDKWKQAFQLFGAPFEPLS
eukprot:TRINITY_DN1932_c0_g1_i2.p1 TRINITY_DN1932_c0_g1~~TRINITY_DN1932_c0_g1_i2.p1  ORF type:complete len:418 (+),score=88.38 TRINITY_DN1932_c0_g1_i2:636-1889(+)